VWTGKEVIVWGGSDGSADVNTGGRYNPATNTWLPTDSAGGAVPAAREGQAAVWTGKRMLIWGGSSVKDGAMYDPSTNSWTAMSTTNQPGGGATRVMFPFVWTGRQLIVWGGYDGGYPADGGMFDPSNGANGTWTVMSTTGAPTGRHHSKAVWTGRKMVIWGGHTPSTEENTPYLFDPAAGAGGTWSTGSPTGAPAGRNFPAMVWTGKEVIVWGGTASLTYNDGGRYDPVADKWSPLASTALSPRWHHAFTWTGKEMLIWGGTNGSALASGAAYNPRTNTWRTLSSTNLSARYFEFAHGQATVWTGREWFIWGGTSDGSNRFNTGARFIPGTSVPGGFFDNMENGVNGWTTQNTGGNNLWAQVSDPTCSPASTSSSHSWYFGLQGSCNFDGGLVSGRLVSPQFTVPAAGALTFKSRRQGECGGCTYDKAWVEISTNGGSTWTVLQEITDNSNAWQTVGALNLSAYAGQNVELGFEFNSVDGAVNAYTGWMIDDVSVTTP
jgi:hypothetical protein